MQAGLLRDFVSLESPETTRDRFGAQVQVWSAVWSGRAWVRFSSGTQTVVNGETLNTVTRKVTIRTRATVTPSMRVTIKNLHYRILSIDDSARDLSKTMIVELINE